MTDDAHSGGRAIDAATLSRVHALLERHGVDLRDPDGAPGAGFVVLNLNDYGLAMAVIDGVDGTIIDTVTVHDVGAEAIDAAVATRLVEVGRVQAPTNAEWGAELRRLIASGRHRLGASDGVFIMGEDYVRLFRLTRNDVRGAIGDQIDFARSKWDGLVAGRSVRAAVLGASPQAWPGIGEIASAIVHPALLRVSVADEQPEPVQSVQPPAVTPRHMEVPLQSPEQDSSAPEHPAAPLSADPPTDRIPVYRDRPARTVTPEAVVENVDWMDLPSWSLVGEHSWDGASAQQVDDTSEPSPQRPAPQHIRRKVMIGSLACALLVGMGAVSVFALSDGGARSSAAVDNSAGTLTGVTPPPSTELPEPSYAAPEEVAAAAQSAVPYTTPPPPPPTSSRSESSAERPRNPPRPRPQRPRRNTIPNPIPGLPPIVLPG